MDGYGLGSSTNLDDFDSFHHLNPFHVPSIVPDGLEQPMSRNHPELRPRYPQQSSLDSSNDHNSQLLAGDTEDGMPGASDFVRKLFRMLEDPAFANIVCWGAQRDCFIVKDMTEFTKIILPRLFKHSNFASFVKNTDENAYGEHCWTFRHPKFRADHLEGLEDIKRKSAPARRSSGRHAARSKSPSDSPTIKDSSEVALVSNLQNQIDQLLQTQHDLKSHIVTLESNYRGVLDEMASFQRSMASQDALIQNLLQHLVNVENPARSTDPSKPLGSLDSNFISEEAQRLVATSSYNPEDVARASLQQLTELSRRANKVALPPTLTAPQTNPPPNSISNQPSLHTLDSLPRLQTDTGISTSAPPTNSQMGSPPQSIPVDWSNHKGLQVLTVGHLLPRSSQTSTADDTELEEQVMPSTSYPGAPATPSTRLRVRRKTYVPGWAVPPRVLLVEDDAVSRKLSSKFLQVLGVTADVAVDGDAAVKQMCLERYDLVLMDIVMPRLDGVAATSLIRQFDHRTPIISMTSNSCPQDILNYYSHGMNDILPKPFTRDGLFSMLEKHLNHLKAISQLSQVPRPLEDTTDRIKEVDTTAGYNKAEECQPIVPVHIPLQCPIFLHQPVHAYIWLPANQPYCWPGRHRRSAVCQHACYNDWRSFCRTRASISGDQASSIHRWG
ncbi:related to SKN7-transcription factor (C-terminal fragment) [Serendipita indica DSM 11827]|uniref:Related to SKN7-transcription factor (C-terminal) n=1 Tax=Serendipita indica (strain DSM 11827) TaxID=1109443 RepID=G4T5P2_SERID|nr:related to SKN7-transcription factor (C-terminal fragment) [Serendipita indica DSM 11827]